MENMNKKNEEKYKASLRAKLEYVKKMRGKAFEEILEQQKSMHCYNKRIKMK
jgi:hypothetical protein